VVVDEAEAATRRLPGPGDALEDPEGCHADGEAVGGAGQHPRTKLAVLMLRATLAFPSC
jgi:hypothetical protein